MLDRTSCAQLVRSSIGQQAAEGRYKEAAALAVSAQEAAPRGTSALIQATAQEGRAWARLGDQPWHYHEPACASGPALTRTATSQPGGFQAKSAGAHEMSR